VWWQSTLSFTSLPAGSYSGASLDIGGMPVAVAYAGKQPEFAGLDQINAELPRSLACAGTVTVFVTVDGKPANPVTLAFR